MRRQSYYHRTISYAAIEYSLEENDYGTMTPAVVAKCLETGCESGIVWGSSFRSVKRALAVLTDRCNCGASFHYMRKQNAT